MQNNNFTQLEIELKYFEANILPCHRLIIIISAALGLLISPFAGYISYVATPNRISQYMYYGIYSRICLITFATILLLWQPVCISPIFIIYSQGIIKHFNSTIQFIMLWILLASGVCSAHAIGSKILYLCKISLLPCKSWHGDPKKYRFLLIFFVILVTVTITMFWLTFPDSDDSIRDYIRKYPFLIHFLTSEKQFLAFNIYNIPFSFKIFVIYLAILIPVYLLIFTYLFYDYHRTLKKQQKSLTTKAQSVITALTVSMKIRLLVIFSFLGFPFIVSCLCLYLELSQIHFSICICMFSMFPFLDAFVEIFTIKFYRHCAINYFTFGCIRFQK